MATARQPSPRDPHEDPTPRDTGPDTWPDMWVDTEQDTPGDTGADIGARVMHFPTPRRPDTPRDTEADTDPDTWVDTDPDTEQDIAPDTAVDIRADIGAGSASHFDVDLDVDVDPSEGPRRSVPVLAGDAPVIGTTGPGRLPVVPSEWAGWDNIKLTLWYYADLTRYRAAYHAIRTPKYALLASFWAVVGVFRLIGRQLKWWWVLEQHGLRQHAADTNDPMLWLKLHREAKNTRTWRGIVLLAETLGLLLVAPAVLRSAPWWVLLPALVLAVSGLAHLGRPIDRPIVTPAVTQPRFRRLNPDIVLRAYYAAGLGKPDKPDQEISFASPMARDGAGSRVVIDLPYGKGFDEVLARRGAIASGLDVSINQVYLKPVRSSHRRHILWVADQDPLAIPAGRTPLLDGRVRNIWDKVPFGLDERGAKVAICLMWISILIGSQPRKGKTFSARLFALFAALDPWVRIYVVDGKNSPDWRRFSLVAHAMAFGTHPTRDGDPVEQTLGILREVKAHIMKVNDVLSALPVAVCPEGKLTPELSRDPRFPDLRVWMLVMEEFQLYYELDNKEASEEVAELLSYIQAVGPSSGVILISASQKPSGIGAGAHVQKLFTRFRDNHAARFALKCGNRNVSESILGGDAYGEGFDASALPMGEDDDDPTYKGIGYLYGLTSRTPTVRTYLADHEDAEKILLAARAHRERLGKLSGLAAGEKTTREVRDTLADVRKVIRSDERGISWERLAERLAHELAEHYADITPAAISSQLREAGIRSVNIKDDGQVRKGARLAEIDAAITRRATR